jgi:hypothetical protein
MFQFLITGGRHWRLLNADKNKMQWVAKDHFHKISYFKSKVIDTHIDFFECSINLAGFSYTGS